MQSRIFSGYCNHIQSYHCNAKSSSESVFSNGGCREVREDLKFAISEEKSRDEQKKQYF